MISWDITFYNMKYLVQVSFSFCSFTIHEPDILLYVLPELLDFWTKKKKKQQPL